MTLHNITGHERSGPHVVIREFKGRPTRTSFWIITTIQGLVCAVPTAFILAMVLQ